MSRIRQKSFVPVLLALVIALVWFGLRQGWFEKDDPAAKNPRSAKTGQTPATTVTNKAPDADSPHLVLGTPVDNTPADDHLLLKSQYALSYNPRLVSANWVAWRLERASFGKVGRHAGKFAVDTDIPAGMPRASHEDYTGSGYDRGHLCRSLDRTDKAANNLATFLMSNIIPQTHDLNAGPWLKLEDYAASLATDTGKVLYIVAGGAYKADCRRIGENRVAVPDRVWKIIAVLDPGQSVTDIGPKTRLIAVMMPNGTGIGRHDWRRYRVSVDSVEETSGYDFHRRIPSGLQETLEARVDNL